MNSFKVGDKVVFVRYENEIKWEKNYRFKVGDVGVINYIDNNGKNCVIKNDNGTLHTLLAQLEPFGTKSELEQLVEKANEWAGVCKNLRQKYPNQAEVSYNNSPFITFVGEHMGYKFRITPKPSFQPFCIGKNWRVEIDGETVKVGCKYYDARNLCKALQNVRDGCNSNNNSLVAMKCGVRDGDHFVPWHEVDKLIEALTKAGF